MAADWIIYNAFHFSKHIFASELFQWHGFIKYSLHYLVVSSCNIYINTYECNSKLTLVQNSLINSITTATEQWMFKKYIHMYFSECTIH